jgi:hypothetical protein
LPPEAWRRSKDPAGKPGLFANLTEDELPKTSYQNEIARSPRFANPASLGAAWPRQPAHRLPIRSDFREGGGAGSVE